MLAEHNARVARDEQARQVKLNELHDKYGLRLSNTKAEARRVNATGPSITADVQKTGSASEQSAKDSPSGEEGQDAQNEAPDGQNN
jgi:hypothetical protein